MSAIPPIVLAAAVLWILGCVALFVVVCRGWLARPKNADPHRFPGLRLNGLFLLALAPIVSGIQFLSTGGRMFWAGAGILVVGLIMITYGAALKRWHERPAGPPPFLTFREKSLTAQIAAILLVYGWWGAQLWGRPLSPVGAVGALIGLTVLMIVISVASHIALALWRLPEQVDERDALVAMRGARNAYYALGAGVWCVLMLAIAASPFSVLFLGLSGAFALAEVVRLASQLVYYRLGV